jgi:hypothetical protein
MAKPWLERWVKDLELSGRVEAEGDLDTYVTDGYESDDRTRLISAAPDMCRALLAVEWKGLTNYGTAASCPECDEEQRFGCHLGDTIPCALDAALTKAGLPDQASRDAARKELGL